MRKLAPYRGIMENGRVTLPSDAGIPDKTRFMLSFRSSKITSAPYVASLHLANPEQAKDFEKPIIEDTTDAEV